MLLFVFCFLFFHFDEFRFFLSLAFEFAGFKEFYSVFLLQDFGFSFPLCLGFLDAVDWVCGIVSYWLCRFGGIYIGWEKKQLVWLQ